MNSQNRYYSHARISEEKLLQLVHYFARDCSATEAAELSGMTRKSVTTIFLKIRRRMAQECERNSQLLAKEVRASEKCGPVASSRTPIFGLIVREEKVYTAILPDPLGVTLRAMIHGQTDPQTVSLSDGWRGYDGVFDVNYPKYLRVNHKVKQWAPVINNSGVIDDFWRFTRSRFQKLNGVARHTFYLHLKECEWRFNMRHVDLENELLKVLGENPL